MRTCQKCKVPDFTAVPRFGANLRVLCAECYCDERSSSTRRVPVKTREVEDRYTALARRHGL